jgi:acetamidase/formamidase
LRATAQSAENAQQKEEAMPNIGALSIGSLLLSVLALPNASLAAEYTLMPSPQTVHIGHFSAALKPVLTINSGDIVIIETVHTGNLGNRDLSAGTTLFMPIYAPGALFSVGDAHAAQGQGEVDLTAIETGLRGKFQFIVRKDMKVTWPP